ncbi:MAG: GTP-binding protein [Promethearchaeota archaeon]
MSDEYDYLFKSIVVGDGGVGKTALTLRFSKGFFTEDYKMTIGVDFHVKTINIDTENEGPLKVKLQIWDTGGQERFSSIRPMYYRGSLGALLIFDLTSYESFEHLPQWIEEVRANIKDDVPLLLVGNKSDLVDERALSIEEINDFTRKFNLYYMETSAKTGDGVGDCFYILACLMVGAEVPDQLLSQGIVYYPGQVLAKTSSSFAEISSQVESKVNVPFIPEPILEPEPEIDFSAPPVPEPEPEIEFSAPPVPEPEPELKFSAPYVPEPEPELKFTDLPIPKDSSAKIFKPVSSPSPEIPISEPRIEKPVEQAFNESSEIEFKTPEEILSELSKSPKTSESPVFKPKAVPFSSNIPVPAPAPKEFRPTEEIQISENTTETKTPFLVKKSETPYTSSEPASESLVEYMPEVILSKKQLKKIEKEKKKEEKEKKLQERRIKAAKLQEEMQNVKKEKAKKEKKEKIKKEKKQKLEEIEMAPSFSLQTPSSQNSEPDKPALFETLIQKTEKYGESITDKFVPFTPKPSSETQEFSKLRIIPNVADIDSETGTIPNLPSVPTVQYQERSSKRKEIIICEHCGSILSSDYAFCNKCGSKL